MSHFSASNILLPNRYAEGVMQLTATTLDTSKLDLTPDAAALLKTGDGTEFVRQYGTHFFKVREAQMGRRPQPNFARSVAAMQLAAPLASCQSRCKRQSLICAVGAKLCMPTRGAVTRMTQTWPNHYPKHQSQTVGCMATSKYVFECNSQSDAMSLSITASASAFFLATSAKNAQSSSSSSRTYADLQKN